LVATRPTAVSPSVSFEHEALDDSGPSRTMLAVQGGAGLSASQREIEWLAATFQGVTVWRADRSVPDSATLAGYEALHFAGRVTYDDQDPFQTGVDAGRRHAAPPADYPPPGADGIFHAKRIALMRLRADLVVLTSCAHASSTYGPAPFPTSFLAAGARAVIVPLWPLDDRDVESFVRELYRTLDTGQPIGEAFRQAQDHQRRTSGTQHPHYWAGWALWGDGSAKIDLKPNPIWKRGTPSNLKH
jgi:CHAT domain-containing protein